MAAIKTITRSAIAAFSPADNYIAAGTVAGSLDSSFSSSTFLEIFQLDFASDGVELPVIGSCVTSDSLCRLCWSPATSQHPSGLLAGSLADGGIHVWNPAVLVSDYSNGKKDSTPLMNLETDKQKVLGLDFDSLTPNLLAAGASDGVVHVWDLDTNKHFPTLQSKAGEISSLAWNLRNDNILASASYDGTCVVWDLKKEKSILRFSDLSGNKRYSALQWHPEYLTKLVLAVEDDNAPYLQEWDLRNTSQPSQVFKGHTKGILSLAWCPNDSSMLVSCGKDSRTLCWDVAAGQVIGELPSSSSWSFDVKWSSRTPGVLSTSSYDGKIGIYSIESCFQMATSVYKAPKWLKRPVGTSFGFGGKLVTFSAKPPPGASEVKIHTLGMDEDLVKCSTEFEAAIIADDRKVPMRSFCDRKAQEVESDQERELWEFLKLMLEEDDGRKTLLNQLGFPFVEADTVADDLAEAVADVSVADENSFQVVDDGEDFFENLEQVSDTEVVPVEMNGKLEEVVDAGSETGETDEAIEQALVVGNFKGAVDHCMSVDRMADALVIAYAGGPALWEKTRNEYVKRNRRTYLQVLSAIAGHDLKGLVESRPLTAWKETLALLGTYSRGDEWTYLADTLASRLDVAGDSQAATICYICAGNVEKTVEVLSRAFDVGSHGKQAVNNLQDLVEKSIVLSVATDRKRNSPALTTIVERYAELLANQGLVESAMVYISLVPGELSQSLTYLQDRISRSREVPTKPVSTDSYEAKFEHTAPTPIQQVLPEQNDRYLQQQHAAPKPQYPVYTAYSRNQFPPPNQPPVRGVFPTTPPANLQPVRSYVPANVTVPNLMVPRPAQSMHAPVPFTPVSHSFVNPPQAPPFNPAPAPLQTPVNQAASYPPQPTSSSRSFVNPPQAVPFNPAPFQPTQATSSFANPPQPTPQVQPLISHLTDSPAAPTPPPTVQNVDTSNVKDEFKPVVAALRRLYSETSEAVGVQSNPGKRREAEDNSRKLGALFVKLSSGDVSPGVSAKLVQLSQAVDGRNYPAALEVVSDLTTRSWDECGAWLTCMRRMIKSRQAMS